MQFRHIPVVLVDDRADRRQDVGAGLRHRREPQFARIRLDAGNLRQRRDLAARRRQLVGFFEPQADRVVIAGTRFERARCFIGDDAPVGDDDGARAHLVNLFQDVSGDDHQFVLAQFVDEPAHLMLLIGIQTIGGLVQDQDLRVMNQCLCQADTPAKTLGQCLDDLVDDRRQPQPVDDDAASLRAAVRRAGRAHPRRSPGIRRTVISP